MLPLKQSAAITVPFFVHDVNGDAVTGLTDGSFTKRISKNGAAFGAMTVTISEMENGWYSFPLSASHSDTLGILSIVFTNAGAKQVNLQWRVSARIPDDLAFPTTTGRSIDVTATGEVGVDLDNTVGSLAKGTEITGFNDITAGDVWAVDATTQQTQGTFGQAIGDPGIDTDTIWALANANLDAAISTRSSHTAAAVWAVGTRDITGGTVDTCTTNTDMRGTDNALLAASAPANFGDLAITVTTGRVTVGTNLDKTGYSISGTKTTLDALQDISATDVKTQADQALVDIDLDHLIQVTAGVEEPTIGAYLDQIMHKSAGQTFSQATDSLEALRDQGDTAWITAVGFSTHNAADVRTEMDANSTQLAAIVGDTNELQLDWQNGGRLDLILDAILDDTGTTGVAIAVGAIGSTQIGTDAIGADELAADGANEFADALLKRDLDQVEATAPKHSMASALLKAVSRVRNNAGTLETYRTNGTTIHMSQTITTDVANQPLDELTVGV